MTLRAAAASPQTSATPTDRIYFTAMSCLSLTASILHSGEDARGPYVVVDRTIFHPQGGGQPADSGSLTLAGATLAVTDVRCDPEGAQIRHYVGHGDFAPQTAVVLQVDSASRKLASQLHSGGHLLAHLMLELLPEAKPHKGYHFPDAPCVSFHLAEKPDLSALQQTLNAQLRAYAEMDLRTEVSFAEGSQARLIKWGEFAPMPCGGTHIESLRELLEMQVLGVKHRAGILKIRYGIVPRP